MGFAADRLKQEHGVEGCDFKHPDMWHAEEVGDIFDRLAGRPASGLLLSTPENRDHGGGLSALGIFGDLLLRPGKILCREDEALWLLFGRSKAADRHSIP